MTSPRSVAGAPGAPRDLSVSRALRRRLRRGRSRSPACVLCRAPELLPGLRPGCPRIGSPRALPLDEPGSHRRRLLPAFRPGEDLTLTDDGVLVRPKHVLRLLRPVDEARAPFAELVAGEFRRVPSSLHVDADLVQLGVGGILG